MIAASGFEVVGLVGTLVGTILTLALGTLAIWLALHFHRMSTTLQDAANTSLNNIKASTATTEVVAKDILKPVIETVVTILRDTTRSSIDTAAHLFMVRATARFNEVMQAQTDEEKQEARSAFVEELDGMLGALRSEVGKVGLSLESESSRPILSHEGVGEAVRSAIPGSAAYDWTAFIRRIRDLENSNRFLSVKWLREKKFAGDKESQQALQVALDNSMLLKGFVDNPHTPEFPVTTCRLNEAHPTVRDVLAALSSS